MNNIYYLAHGGPGSGRYPLGSGERPYQKFEGSRRKSGGISGYIKAKKQKKAEEQLEKQKREIVRKRMEVEAERRKFEANKENVLRSGTASEVLKYQGKLTNQELRIAVDRFQLENAIKDYSTKETRTALDKLQTMRSYTNVGAALAKDGVSLWNSLASIYNATPNGKDNPLGIIGDINLGKAQEKRRR